MLCLMSARQTFTTSDMSLVATLLCFNASIECVDRTSLPRATFHLRNDDGFDDVVQAFYSHSLRVDPLTYFHALKEAKTRLYADHR